MWSTGCQVRLSHSSQLSSGLESAVAFATEKTMQETAIAIGAKAALFIGNSHSHSLDYSSPTYL
jgi:hypothetical protein